MGSEVVERIPVGTRFALRTEPGYVLTVVEDDGERIVCTATMEGRQKPGRHGEGLRRHILEDFDRLPPQAPEKREPRVGDVWRRNLPEPFEVRLEEQLKHGSWRTTIVSSQDPVFRVGESLNCDGFAEVRGAWTLVSPAPTPPVEVRPPALHDGPCRHGVPCAQPVPEKRAPVCDFDNTEPLQPPGCWNHEEYVPGVMRVVKADSEAPVERTVLCDACYLRIEEKATKHEADEADETELLPRDSWQPQASRQGTCWRTRGGRW